MKNELFAVIKGFKEEKEVTKILKKTVNTGKTNLRELFDIGSDEYKTFPIDFRMEIIKYLLTCYHQEELQEPGSRLSVLFNDWEYVTDNDLSLESRFCITINIAEYLLLKY